MYNTDGVEKSFLIICVTVVLVKDARLTVEKAGRLK